MSFKKKNLVFSDYAIYYYIQDNKQYVMMDWEKPLMELQANYACENGGDILEIGFGMGISADYIQSNKIKSHTIIEIHPDVLNKAFEWAKGKPNVNIMAGDWYNMKNLLGTYDGIFLDTYGDKNIYKFKDVINDIAKPGCNITWWNNSIKPNHNTLGIENVVYQEVNISPNKNGYFETSKYYLPKKQM